MSILEWRTALPEVANVGRAECNEFRQWITLEVGFAETRSTRYGLQHAFYFNVRATGQTPCMEFYESSFKSAAHISWGGRTISSSMEAQLNP